MDWDALFWIAVVVVVGISKVLGKLKENAAEEEEPPPPQPRPMRRLRPAAQPKASPVAPPPVLHEKRPKGWQTTADELREFLERIQPPQATAAPKPPPPPPSPPAAAPPAPAAKPASARPQPAPARPAPVNRAAQWAAALRDRQNIRNIIVAAEIIGPPKANR